MAWKLIGSPTTCKATTELAARFVAMEPAPHDRPMSERRLRVYRKMLEEGSFRPVTWATAYCTEMDSLYRVNGKHTSTLLAGYNPVPDFYVTIEEYQADTLDDVARLYSTFDSNMQSRTALDIYLAFAATVPELRRVPAKIIGTCAAGMAYALYGADTYNRTQAAERAELLLEHSDFVEWTATLVSGGPSAASINSPSKMRSAHIIRQPVFAAMYKCWEQDECAATQFWEAVRDETGASPILADRVLARYLMTTTLRTTHVSKGGHYAGLREIYVKCLHGWNAWRKGETTRLNYYGEADVPGVR